MMISLYYWRGRKKPFYEHLFRALRGISWHSPARELSFSEYIQYLSDNKKLNIDKLITFIDGELPNYRIIRFEHLHQDMENVCNDLNIEYDPERMPKKKVGYRSNHSYREYYNEITKELVANAYAQEIEKFGYVY